MDRRMNKHMDKHNWKHHIPQHTLYAGIKSEVTKARKTVRGTQMSPTGADYFVA